MRVFILEDDQERIKKFRRELIGNHVVITTTVEEAKEWLKKEQFDVLFLDHDLGGAQNVKSGKGTGYEVAEFIRDNDIPYSLVIIHSCYHAGSTSMKFVLPCAIPIPFPLLNIEAALTLGKECTHERENPNQENDLPHC